MLNFYLPEVPREFVFVLGVSGTSWNMYYLLDMQIMHDNLNELSIIAPDKQICLKTGLTDLYFTLKKDIKFSYSLCEIKRRD